MWMEWQENNLRKYTKVRKSMWYEGKKIADLDIGQPFFIHNIRSHGVGVSSSKK